MKIVCLGFELKPIVILLLFKIHYKKTTSFNRHTVYMYNFKYIILNKILMIVIIYI